MLNLLNKVVNSYKNLLNNLNYGRFSQDYNLLYDAILLLKNDLTEEKYIQYFSNLLNSPTFIALGTPQLLYYGISSLEVISKESELTLEELVIPELKQYNIKTSLKMGDNYIYLAIPQDLDFTIYDDLGDSWTDEFTEDSTLEIQGITYDLYKTYIDTENAINFKIILI